MSEDETIAAQAIRWTDQAYDQIDQIYHSKMYTCTEDELLVLCVAMTQLTSVRDVLAKMFDKPERKGCLTMTDESKPAEEEAVTEEEQTREYRQIIFSEIEDHMEDERWVGVEDPRVERFDDHLPTSMAVWPERLHQEIERLSSIIQYIEQQGRVSVPDGTGLHNRMIHLAALCVEMLRQLDEEQWE